MSKCQQRRVAALEMKQPRPELDFTFLTDHDLNLLEQHMVDCARNRNLENMLSSFADIYPRVAKRYEKVLPAEVWQAEQLSKQQRLALRRLATKIEKDSDRNV